MTNRAKLKAKLELAKSNSGIARKQELQALHALQETALFKRGDKVEYKNEIYLIFVLKLQGNGEFLYYLTKPKKDGSMPKVIINGKYYAHESEIMEIS